jgi:hypothetical protein
MTNPPGTITVTIPRKTWRLLRLAYEMRVHADDPARVWRIVSEVTNSYRITLDVRSAIEIRDSAGSASQDKTSFNARERQAIWRIIPRITQQLERLERSK